MSAADRPAAGVPVASDEISLRELYLVLRRRVPWIVAAAVLAGVVAYAVLSLRAPSYVAEATTIVSRAPISVELGTGLSFRPEIDLTFDTYQTLAFSRTVLEAVLPFTSGSDVLRLREALSLERVAGLASQPSSVLAVTHRVRGRDPELGAAAANAWAEATIANVRRLLLENLDAVELITSESLVRARVELEEAEVELEHHRAASSIASLRSLVGHTGSSMTGAESYFPGVLDEAIARLEADSRANRIESERSAAEAAALVSRAAADGVDFEVVLLSAPTVALPLRGAIVALEARVAALTAERLALRSELEELERARAAAAAALSTASATMVRLDRRVEVGRSIVASLEAIEPSVAYVTQVAPSGARMLSEAVVPSRPEPTRRGLVTALVVVVVAFAGVVLALLAEAVREPSPRRA